MLCKKICFLLHSRARLHHKAFFSVPTSFTFILHVLTGRGKLSLISWQFVLLFNDTELDTRWRHTLMSVKETDFLGVSQALSQKQTIKITYCGPLLEYEMFWGHCTGWVNNKLSVSSLNCCKIIAGIRQFPWVQPTGRGYYCAKEEFHANFYSFINFRMIRMQFING